MIFRMLVPFTVGPGSAYKSREEEARWNHQSSWASQFSFLNSESEKTDFGLCVSLLAGNPIELLMNTNRSVEPFPSTWEWKLSSILEKRKTGGLDGSDSNFAFISEQLLYRKRTKAPIPKADFRTPAGTAIWHEMCMHR